MGSTPSCAMRAAATIPLSHGSATTWRSISSRGICREPFPEPLPPTPSPKRRGGGVFAALFAAELNAGNRIDQEPRQREAGATVLDLCFHLDGLRFLRR